MAQLFRSRTPKLRLFPLTLLGILLLAVMSSIPFAFASTPNLEVVVSDDVDSVAPGQLLTYRVTVSNTSATETLSNVVVNNTLPSQVTYVKASDGGSHTGGVVTWSQGLTLEPNTSDYRYVTVRVNSPLLVGTQITDNASAWIVNGTTGDTTSPSTAQDTDTVKNVAPLAQNKSFTTDEGTALPLNLTSLVTDGNGDAVTITLISQPTNGTLTDNGNGSYTYTPTQPEFAGSDSFTYQASDPQGNLSNIATISITVQAVNDAPVAVNDSAANIYEDNTATVLASALLENDTDVDGGALTITAVNPSASGAMVTLSADKTTITYQPAANFNGPDSFTYVVSDGNGGTATGTVSITVDPVNDAPAFSHAGNQSVAEDAGSQTVTSWATGINAGPANEQDQTLTFVVSNDNPTLFSAQPAVNANGTLTYAPAANKSGVATVTVTLRDNGGTANGGVDSTTQTFTITVSALNDAPVANDDVATTQINVSVNVDVLNNDTDADQNALSVVDAQLTAGHPGTVAVNNNIVTYTPPSNYQDTLPFDVTIQYTVTDGTATDTATVFITVTAINNAPTAIDHAFTTNEDTILNQSAPGVITGASDPDAADQNNLKAFLDPNTTTRPKNGRVILYLDGSFTYSPNADFHGTDSFVYGVSDGVNASVLKTVTITVNPVNDLPTITTNGNVSVLEDSAAYSAQWITSSKAGPADEVAAGQTVSWTVTNDSPAKFSVQPAIASNGTLTFTPAPNAFGSVAVTVNVTDSAGGTSTNIFTIAIAPVNDAPTMTAGGNITVAEDSPAFSAAWASGMAVGPTNEDTQVLTFALTNDNTSLFSTQPAVSEDGMLTFTPAANAFGVANVTVLLQDNGGLTNGGVNSTTATFTITITSVSDAPIAVDDQANTTRGQSLTIAATTLLLNDTDPDGDILTISSVSATSTGRGTVTRSGSDIVYTPAAGFVGVDTFTYTITDGQGGSATATVSITIRSQHMLYLPMVVSEVSTVVAPPATPDLVGSFSVSPAKTNFSTTEQVVVTAQVTNQGNAPAGPFWVDLYINPTTGPSTTNIAWNTTCSLQPCQGIAWYVKDGLAPGQSITLTSTSDSYMTGYTIWSGQFAAGTTDLYLYVDSWNPGVATGGVAESNETNNVAAQHGLVVSGTTAQSVAQSVEEMEERPAHPSN